MWLNKSDFDDLQERVKELEKKLAEHPKELTMRLTTPDYQSYFSWCYGKEVAVVGEAREIPIADVIRLLADAAGIELVLEPMKCTGGEVVAKKKRKARS